LCRKPNEKEISLLTAYYDSELKALTDKDASKLLSIGEYPAAANINKIKQAAMMKVVDTLYNLEEAITKT